MYGGKALGGKALRTGSLLDGKEEELPTKKKLAMLVAIAAAMVVLVVACHNDGDGPIAQLRRWYRQFYAAPERPVAQHTA